MKNTHGFKLTKTRYKELAVGNFDTFWQFVDVTDDAPAQVGPQFATKAEALAALPAYALEYGCEGATRPAPADTDFSPEAMAWRERRWERFRAAARRVPEECHNVQVAIDSGNLRPWRVTVGGTVFVLPESEMGAWRVEAMEHTCTNWATMGRGCAGCEPHALSRMERGA